MLAGLNERTTTPQRRERKTKFPKRSWEFAHRWGWAHRLNVAIVHTQGRRVGTAWRPGSLLSNLHDGMPCLAGHGDVGEGGAW